MVRISLMSDPSSVITQVNQNEPVEILNNHPADNREFITEGKKPRRRFASLLCCCFGSKHTAESENHAPPAVNNDPAPIHGPSLLPSKHPLDVHKKCVVIDLDETLVHSSFKPIENADFIVPIEIDLQVHQVYVLKRPYVDEFLQKMGQMYECVLFTASLAKYADPVADLLDKWGVFKARLFRDSCVYYRGNYVKDLGRLGRDLKDVIIIDNSPASYIFHPENAVPVSSWFDDMSDTELTDMLPILEKIAASNDIYSLLRDCVSTRPALQNSPMSPQQHIPMPGSGSGSGSSTSGSGDSTQTTQLAARGRA